MKNKENEEYSSNFLIIFIILRWFSVRALFGDFSDFRAFWRHVKWKIYLLAQNFFLRFLLTFLATNWVVKQLSSIFGSRVTHVSKYARFQEKSSKKCWRKHKKCWYQQKYYKIVIVFNIWNVTKTREIIRQCVLFFAFF